MLNIRKKRKLEKTENKIAENYIYFTYLNINCPQVL